MVISFFSKSPHFFKNNGFGMTILDVTADADCCSRLVLLLLRPAKFNLHKLVKDHCTPICVNSQIFTSNTLMNLDGSAEKPMLMKTQLLAFFLWVKQLFR